MRTIIRNLLLREETFKSESFFLSFICNFLCNVLTQRYATFMQCYATFMQRYAALCNFLMQLFNATFSEILLVYITQKFTFKNKHSSFFLRMYSLWSLVSFKFLIYLSFICHCMCVKIIIIIIKWVGDKRKYSKKHHFFYVKHFRLFPFYF